MTRRRALTLAIGAGAALSGDATTGRGARRTFRRLGLAFGATVSITILAEGAEAAEAAFAAGFAEIRRIDELTSLTHPRSQVFKLNRDGALNDPAPALLAMLRMAAEMHAATDGAFDVTVQPMWLAFDAAARQGSWPSSAEIAALARRVDQTAHRFDARRVEFARAGMAATLNSLARGYAADCVADALAECGVSCAFLDTDVLGAVGRRPDGALWRALVRPPRDSGASVGAVENARLPGDVGRLRIFLVGGPFPQSHHRAAAPRPPISQASACSHRADLRPTPCRPAPSSSAPRPHRRCCGASAPARFASTRLAG